MPTSAAATAREVAGSTTVQPSAPKKASGAKKSGTAKSQSATQCTTNHRRSAGGTGVVSIVELLMDPRVCVRRGWRAIRPSLIGELGER
jgi:hypothetical protein